MKSLGVRAANGKVYRLEDDGVSLMDGIPVVMELSDVISTNLENFLDIVSEDAGFPLMQSQTYEIVGHTTSSITLHLWGDVSADIDDDESLLVEMDDEEEAVDE